MVCNYLLPFTRKISFYTVLKASQKIKMSELMQRSGEWCVGKKKKNKQITGVVYPGPQPVRGRHVLTS